MASGLTRLEIRNGLLDFGSTFYKLDQVTSVQRGERRPYRWLGVALILAGLALVGGEALLNPTGFQLKSGGSVNIWAACGAGGVGMFSFIYAQRCVTISLAGGEKLTLGITNGEFAGRLVEELRRAIRLPAGTPHHIIADLEAFTLETDDSDDLPGEPPVSVGHEAPVARPQAGLPPAMASPLQLPPQMAASPSEWPASPGADAMHPRGPNGHPALPPLNNGIHAGMGERREPVEVRGLGPSLAALAMRPGQAQAGPAGGGFPMSAPPMGHGPLADPPVRAQPAPSQQPGRELAQLMDFVSRAQIQHKDALLDLLRVVDDYQSAGRGSREDAIAHWRSFSDYVSQYLTSVDGLPQLTERAGRSLGRSL